jgi:dCMP deaminase
MLCATYGLTTEELRNIITTPEELKGIIKTRPDWDTYFISLCYFVSTRSSCHDRKLGAIVVKDKAVVSSGFNGAPRGVEDCISKGDYCWRESTRSNIADKNYLNCYAAHAEANAIVNAAYLGAPTKGATLYTIAFPCVECTRLIINAGIKKIVFTEGLNNADFSEKLLNEAGVECVMLDKARVAATMYKALDHLIMRDENGKKKPELLNIKKKGGK